MEDLDRSLSSAEHERRQLEDLAALGLDWDGEVIRQSDRFDRYREILDRLSEADVTYPCFCSRRDIREANRAPHGDRLVATPPDAYPGTCRSLTARERAARAGVRPAAMRVRCDDVVVTVDDEMVGRFSAAVDDFVVRRNDATPAYHVAVVVDDAEQGVTEVVRGDDLLGSTPRHVWLQRHLGLPTPRYVHVPLVMGPHGERLAKRDGAVTLRELRAHGVEPPKVLAALSVSLGLAAPGETPTPSMLVDRFSIETMRSRAGAPVALEELQRWWTPPSGLDVHADEIDGHSG